MTLPTILSVRSVLRCIALTLTLLAIAARAQVTPSQDAYTNTATPTTNYGAKTLLYVESASQTAYIQFDLSAIPSGYTGGNIAKATLKLYVKTVTKAGSFNVDFVNGTWSEATITADLAPALGTTIAAGVPLATTNKGDYLLVDITPALQAWLNQTQANDGIALVGNNPMNATFDSKESTTTSHPPELDIVFAGGGSGGITGINTASGSGLIGGGTSGTLNLSLTNTCSANQVLQWNGSGWMCANMTGGGTITGVIAGTDLTGGGNNGKVTLNLDTTKVPQLAAANTFTGNQTLNGNLSATGVVTGSSFQIGSNLFGFGSYALANAFLGFAGNAFSTGGANTAAGYQALSSNGSGYDNTATGANALFSNSAGYYNTAAGVDALYLNSTGIYNTASGVNALYSNTTGNYNTASGAQALDSNTTGGDNTATGVDALYSNSTGTDNTAAGFVALYGNTTGADNTASGSGALYANITGHDNTASGFEALNNNTTGFENTASGSLALFGNSTGFDNTAGGFDALLGNTTGYRNTGVGEGALYSNLTGNTLTCIGFACSVGADGLRNATAIGAHAVVGESNALVLGGVGQYAVKVGIGTTTPSNVLTIAQGAGHPLSDGWATFSSRRWKTNIETLRGALAKVEQLRGVSYDLKANGQHEVGVIAEEVGAVIPEVVTWEKNGKDAQSVDYGRLTALLIEATKEQQTLIHEQQQQIQAQRAQIKAQQVRIEAERKRGDAQQARIARLSSQVKTIQASLKTSSKADKEIRTAKAEGLVTRRE